MEGGLLNRYKDRSGSKIDVSIFGPFVVVQYLETVCLYLLTVDISAFREE